MNRVVALSLGLLLAGITAPAAAQSDPLPPPTHWQDRFYFGGGVGLGFGDVDYVGLYPQVGYLFMPKVSGGVALSYAYRSYSSPYDDSFTDFGYDIFGRYRITPQAFAQVQYSYTDFEFPLIGGGTASDSYAAILAGGGFVQPMGGNASLVATLLYDFSYADDEPAPYDDPWVATIGIAFGF